MSKTMDLLEFLRSDLGTRAGRALKPLVPERYEFAYCPAGFAAFKAALTRRQLERDAEAAARDTVPEDLWPEVVTEVIV